MAEFFAELKRRHIYRVGAAYVVVAWVLTQAVDVLSQVFELPAWIARPAVVLLAIGFPVALIVAWMIESKPHQAVASAVRSKPTVVDWTLCGAVALVIVLIGYQQSAPRQAGVTASGGAASSQASAISLAVLPFTNLSGDANQEFFSDGMTEEITAALARVPNLRVVGRTSAFQFKGQTKDFAAIRQALGVAYLIDGSVRMAANRVRITATLVQANDGISLWTENYDRELTDVFAIQEDIAQAIAGALRVPLGLGQGERLVSSRTNDLESYQQFLRARALFRARDLPQTISLLNSIVARDPDYAPAWALLAFAESLAANLNPVLFGGSVEEARRIRGAAGEKSERAALEAMRLDPRNPSVVAARARLEADNGRRAAAEDLYRQALALDPSDPDMLDRFSFFLWSSGRLKEILRLREQVRELEPFVPVFKVRTAMMLQDSGQDQAAIALLEAVPPDTGDELVRYARAITLAYAHAGLGRYAEAADALLAMRSNLVSITSVEDAARLLRQAPAKVGAPETLPELEGALDFVYVHIGAPERVMEGYERQLAIDGFGEFTDWSPAFAPVRKSERFKRYVRNSGLLDYWRAKGWPDLCRPVGTDDFVCD